MLRNCLRMHILCRDFYIFAVYNQYLRVNDKNSTLDNCFFGSDAHGQPLDRIRHRIHRIYRCQHHQHRRDLKSQRCEGDRRLWQDTLHLRSFRKVRQGV